MNYINTRRELEYILLYRVRMLCYNPRNMGNLESIWQEAAEHLESSLPDAKKQWIRRISYSGDRDGTLVLSLSSPFYRSTTEKNCRIDIENMVSEIAGHDIPVEFIVDPSRKAPRTERKAERKAEQSEPVSRNTTLNRQYSFDNFIAGDNSSFAFNACKVIAQNPGTSFNPCLIYGGVGLGKTHLLESIGNYIDEHNPKMKIIYVTAESFTNEFIDSLMSKEKISAFKSKYRNVDVLLIDDIHFLQKKDSTQEELFHTFNELYDSHKQIVLTCDRPITELTDITDRLKTRFRKGLNVDLQPPAYETRMAIALQKCREKGYQIDQKVLDYICQSINTNVRDLEGALTTLSSFATLVGKPVTLEIAKEQLKNFIVSPAIRNNDITIDMIIQKTAAYFNVKDYDIRGKSRNKNITLARHISIYLASVLTSYSLSEIGKFMNGKDHTTIMYSVEKIKSILDTDESVRQAVGTIKNDLLNG